MVTVICVFEYITAVLYIKDVTNQNEHEPKKEKSQWNLHKWFADPLTT